MSKTTERLDRDRAHIDIDIRTMGPHEQADHDPRVSSDSEAED